MSKIYSGLTSCIQVCDLIVNAPYKQSLRREYIEYKDAEVGPQRANGVIWKMCENIS